MTNCWIFHITKTQNFEALCPASSSPLFFKHLLIEVKSHSGDCEKHTSEEICKFNALSLLCFSNLVQEEDEIEGLVICLIRKFLHFLL